MKFGTKSNDRGSIAPAPALDRRALERFAVGAPPPASIPPLQAIERGARVTNGWLFRSIPASRTRPIALPAYSSTAPEISIGTPIARRRAAGERIFEPLYLLVPGEESRRDGSAAAAAVRTADRFSGGRKVVLIDLDPDLPRLQRLLGAAGEEGIGEALEFGISLSAVGSALGTDSSFVPFGITAIGADSIFSHEGWKRVVARARRDDVRLLAYMPPDRSRVEAMARHAGGVLLLATPEEERRLRTLLPPNVPVVGVFPPIPLTDADSASDSSGAATAEPGMVDPMPALPPRSTDADLRPETEPRPNADVRPEVRPVTGPALADRESAQAGATSPAKVEVESSSGPEVGGSFAEILEREQQRTKGVAAAPVGDSSIAARDRGSEDRPDAELSEEPPMEAPTARGLTLAAWLVEEERHLAAKFGSSRAADSVDALQGPASDDRQTVPDTATPVTGRLESSTSAGKVGDSLSGEVDTLSSEGARDEKAPATGLNEDARAGAPVRSAIATSHDPEERPETLLDAIPHPPAAPANRDEPNRGLSFEEALAEAARAFGAAHSGTADPVIADLDPVESAAEPDSSSPPAVPSSSSETTARRELLDRGANAMHRYSVPRTSQRAEIMIRGACLIIIAYWTYYIGWRWVETLNLDALWFSIPLALAETWGWITAVLLLFTVWRLNHRVLTPAPPGLSVDVFITTYDEPLEIIRRTAISAREMRYPHKTFVLDDGRREELRAMAAELGVGYITRENNDHAKAGNLNNALKQTSSDFILQLDADHAPLPHMLDRLLGFFGDERVAFVQTPQDFYNTDSFTSDVNEETRRIWEEQRLFFSVVQPGKDSWNSAFYCGSCAVFRRAALDEIGGFSVQSVTEDIETSLVLHARGWKSVYHGESLAYGLAAASAAAFHIQHGRWAQGGMQVLRRFNPLTYPGLTPAQRIGYFFSLTGYLAGLQKLIFYSAPVVFFVTGVLPIRALDNQFLLRFVPYLIGSIALVELLSRGLGFAWIAERYQMAKFWTYTRALPTFFTKKRLRFRVTPKGPSHVPFATYAPQLTLMVATVLAVYWATFAHAQGWIAYPETGWRSLAFQLNFLWAAVNFVLAAYVVRLSVRLQQQRQDHRFSDRFPIRIQPRGRDGRLGERQLALTENLNTGGASFRSVERFDAGTELQITLPLSTREVTVHGIIVHVRPVREPGVPAFSHGVGFRDVPLDVRDAIEIHCAHHAVPLKQMQYKISGNPFSAAEDVPREGREKRRRIHLPTWFALGESGEIAARQENVAFLDEMGDGGASLIMDEAVPPGTPIIFEVPGTTIRGEGLTTFSRALETPIGVRFVVGERAATHSISESAA